MVDWDMVGQRTLARAIADNRDVIPDKTFIEWRDMKISHGRFGRAVCQIANGLRALGVRRGENVMIYMPNCPEYLAAAFALQRIGAVYVTCSTLNSEEEIAYQISHGDVVAVIINEDQKPFVEALVAHHPKVRTVLGVTCGAMEAGSAPLNQMLVANSDVFDEPFPGVEELAIIMYTSGTTGRPKGVLFNHGNLFAFGLNFANAFNYTSDDRILHYFPLYHANGGGALLYPAILRGATLVMVDKFSASRFSAMLVDHAITFTALNATHVKMILNNPQTPQDNQHKVKRVQFALPLDDERRRQFSERFGGIRLVEIYGLTESLGMATCAPVDSLWKAGSAGPPIPGVRLKIKREDGADGAAGDTGEILLKSFSPYGLTQGYYKDSKATAELLADGWLNSGDTGYVDEDGYLWYLERKKDMIKRSGFNVAAAEVERVVSAYEGIKEVAVVGIPDEFREERIVAFLVGKGSTHPDPKMIIAHCAKFLAPYKVPEHIAFMDVLPENFLGKVDKKLLRRKGVELFSNAPD